MSRKMLRSIGNAAMAIGICLIIFVMCCADSTAPGAVELLLKIFVLGTVFMAIGTGCIRVGRRYARSSRH